MAKHSIALIGGDGIGPEVIDQGVIVLKALEKRFGVTFDFQAFDWGTDYYFKHGVMMPSDGLDSLAKFDSIFFGAVGHPDVQDHITLNGLLLPMRRSFDQYVCQRPSYLYPGVTSPLRGYDNAGDIDMIVIRENTEGEYANVGGFLYENFKDEVAVQSGVFTRHGIDREDEGRSRRRAHIHDAIDDQRRRFLGKHASHGMHPLNLKIRNVPCVNLIQGTVPGGRVIAAEHGPFLTSSRVRGRRGERNRDRHRQA